MPKYPYKTIGLPLDLANWEQLNKNFDDIETDLKNQNTKIDNTATTIRNELAAQIIDSAKINWQAPVGSFANLATSYPSAQVGWTAMVRDTGKVYRFNGTDWLEIQDIDPTAINEVDSRLTSQLADTTKQIEPLGQNILLHGGSMNGTTPNDDAFNAARLVNRKSDYKGRVYFPNNEVGNAVYYFTNTPVLDNAFISADKGVKLSFPNTNGRTFKNVVFKDDITIISRDRNNEGTQYKSDFPKSLYASMLPNDASIGLKKPSFLAGAATVKKNYFQNGSPTVAGSISYFDALQDTFKSSDGSSPTDLGKYLITETNAQTGYMYNCVFVSRFGAESSADQRSGVLLAKSNDQFVFYSLDINKKLYIGIRNGGWTETVNTKFQSVFNDAYTVKKNVLISTRIVKANVIEFYVNGTLTDTVTLPFDISTVGFGMNFVNAPSSGVNTIIWGKITYGKVEKANVGRPLKAIGFGDSITFGEGAISWADYLPKLVEGQRGIGKLDIVNRAVSGHRSDQQLALMQAEDLSAYDVVLILVGTNDIQQSVSVATFSGYVQSMIDLAKANGRKVILGIPPMWISQGLTGTGFASANFDNGAQHRAELLKLAAVNGCLVADTMSEIGRIGADNHLATLRDNLHPNTFGEILLSRCFARSLVSAFSEDVGGGSSASLIDTTTYNLSLQNGWVAFGGVYAEPRYYKDFGGSVRVEGLIKSGTTTSGTVVATLPVGYRPDKTLMFFTGTSAGAATVEVHPGGNIVASGGFSQTWTSLAGIAFKPV